MFITSVLISFAGLRGLAGAVSGAGIAAVSDMASSEIEFELM
jgi:hypothetical protein